MSARSISPELIRGFIAARGVKQSTLARNALCSPSLVSMLARGTRRKCDEGIAQRIEEALGLAAGTLFEPAGKGVA